MICVREVGCKERGERSEALVHRLAHVSNDYLVAFSHGRVCGMHEHMLERYLHCRGALGSGLADELCDRRVPQSRLLQVQLEVFEVFVIGPGKHSHVLSESVAVFSRCLRVLLHQQLPDRICSDRSELWRIPPGVWIGNSAFAEHSDVGVEMVLQLLSIHEVCEKVAP